MVENKHSNFIAHSHCKMLNYTAGFIEKYISSRMGEEDIQYLVITNSELLFSNLVPLAYPQLAL